jgi:AraC-like DNA-binding protein
MPPGETVAVTGVCTRRFDVEVRGWGRVVGLRFRPGGLTALTGHPASAWTDRSVPATEVLPRALVAELADPDLAHDGSAWAEAAEAGLAALADERSDPRYVLLLDVVADMLADHSLLTVADVADRHAVTVRTLQRLFTHYVGVGPKWVLARYRLHDAVADLDAGRPGTLTELAVRYGWYDQAHFARDFTALVGVTPGQYRDRATTADAGHPASGPR